MLVLILDVIGAFIMPIGLLIISGLVIWIAEAIYGKEKLPEN